MESWKSYLGLIFQKWKSHSFPPQTALHDSQSEHFYMLDRLESLVQKIYKSNKNDLVLWKVDSMRVCSCNHCGGTRLQSSKLLFYLDHWASNFARCIPYGCRRVKMTNVVSSNVLFVRQILVTASGPVLKCAHMSAGCVFLITHCSSVSSLPPFALTPII